MKILQIPDSPWSIGRLCEGIRKYNTHIDWEVIFVPPRNIQENIKKVREAVKRCDLVDFQYWNVARQLVDLIPELKNKPKILTHHNQKHTLKCDWFDFDMITCKTNKNFKALNEKYPGKVVKIENVPDHDYFEWIDDYPPKEPAVGYCGRIVPWKNLKEIAQVCYELGYPLYIMGAQDKINYWNEIPEKYKNIMRFDFMECKDDERMNFYKSITIYVGNSNDGREEGTLPFLEALACGVPVVTTANGMAADIVKDEESALLVDFDNYEDLKEQIKRAMDDEKLRLKLRENGWQAIKNFTYQRMARQYEKVFNKVLNPDEPLISVIIPATYDRINEVKDILLSLENQTYKNIEAIIVWDEILQEDHKHIVITTSLNFKTIHTNKDGYNLALARNMGIIEAIGEVLVFCDSRLKPEPTAIAEFAKAVLENKDRTWFFGDKGSQKKTFVENFSAIRREYIIKAGMFNERVNRYGGMSQELRGRFKWQGFTLKYLDEAKAEEIKSSKLTPGRRKDIIAMKNLLYKMNL